MSDVRAFPRINSIGLEKVVIARGFGSFATLNLTCIGIKCNYCAGLSVLSKMFKCIATPHSYSTGRTEQLAFQTLIRELEARYCEYHVARLRPWPRPREPCHNRPESLCRLHHSCEPIPLVAHPLLLPPSPPAHLLSWKGGDRQRRP